MRRGRDVRRGRRGRDVRREEREGCDVSWQLMMMMTSK